MTALTQDLTYTPHQDRLLIQTNYISLESLHTFFSNSRIKSWQ